MSANKNVTIGALAAAATAAATAVRAASTAAAASTLGPGATATAPVQNKFKTFADVAINCDNYTDEIAKQVTEKSYWIRVEGQKGLLGQVYQEEAAHLLATPESWSLSKTEPNTLVLKRDAAALAASLRSVQAKKLYPTLGQWRDELQGLFGDGGELVLAGERAGMCMIGVLGYGVHMTVYYFDNEDASNPEQNMRIWVGRRSPKKSTFPNMLDNAAGGAIAPTGEVRPDGLPVYCTPLNTMGKEANEEASLDEDFVVKNAVEMRPIRYINYRNGIMIPKQTKPDYYVQPDVQFCYRLRVPADKPLVPLDMEVQNFEVMTVAQVKASLLKGEWKPNAGAVMLDFLREQKLMSDAEWAGCEEHVTRKLPYTLSKVAQDTIDRFDAAEKQ